MSEADRLLFPHEVREIVRLSETTLWRLRRRGAFPAPVALGERRVAYRETEVREWLASRERRSLGSRDATSSKVD